MKNCKCECARIHNVNILKKYIVEKDFEILRWPFVTDNDFWGHTSLIKTLRLCIVSIHRKFYQNLFVNECARKKRAKIPESRSFLVRYRRAYILKNISKKKGDF